MKYKRLLIIFYISLFLAIGITSNWGFAQENIVEWTGNCRDSLIAPLVPTNNDKISFSIATFGTYGNPCFGDSAAGGKPIILIDEINHIVELYFQPPVPDVCPLYFMPVCGLKGEFGPLSEGNWAFFSSNQVASFNIPFQVTAEPSPTPTTVSPTETPTPIEIESFVNERSDINEDGRVDYFDLLILQSDWHKITGP